MSNRVQSGGCSSPVAVSLQARRVRSSRSGPRPRRDGLAGGSVSSSSSGSLVSSLVVLRVTGFRLSGFGGLVSLREASGGFGSDGPDPASPLDPLPYGTMSGAPESSKSSGLKSAEAFPLVGWSVVGARGSRG